MHSTFNKILYFVLSSTTVDDVIANLESETKLKSLQLRIKGQLQSIKSLEEKLASTVAELEDKASMLATVQRKLVSIERKEKLKYRGLSKEEHERTLAHVEDQLLHLKVCTYDLCMYVSHVLLLSVLALYMHTCLSVCLSDCTCIASVRCRALQAAR